MDISNISVSRLDVWRECTQRYKYQYHLKIEPEEPEPFYFTYGTIIHKIAEEYVWNRGEQLLEEVAHAVVKGEIPLKDGKPLVNGLPPDYAKRLPGDLRAIQRLTDKIGLEGWVEYEFQYDLDPPHERYLKGVIDRLIQKGDKFFIIDYKTTKRGRFRKKYVTNDLQLRCYARVVQRQFQVPAHHIKAGLYYLDGGESVAASFNDQSLIAAETELLEGYKEIANTPPEAAYGNVGDHCTRCRYRKQCPFYRIT